MDQQLGKPMFDYSRVMQVSAGNTEGLQGLKVKPARLETRYQRHDRLGGGWRLLRRFFLSTGC